MILEYMFFSLVVVVTLPPYWFLYKLFRHSKFYTKKQWPEQVPAVTVIMPCKGGDLTFRENLKSLFRQNYPNFEVIFVTATEDDPARDVIQEMISETKIPARLLVAGISPHCGQKMNNMCVGVQSARSNSTVFVFLDGDVYIHANFLANLVAPLSDPSHGTCCGYHMFVPTKGNLGAALRFEWSIGGMLVLADAKRNFSIGAATAIRKETFEKAKMLDRLKTTISDTFCFTNGVRSLGLKVHFEPKCIFVSNDESSFREMLAWSNRLVIISRNYSPSLWRWTVFSFNLSVLLIIFGLLTTVFSFNAFIIVGLGLLLFLQMVHSQFCLLFLKAIAQENYPKELKLVLRMWGTLTLLAPVIPFVVSWNCLNSIFSNQFVWRGIRYRLHGQDSVEVFQD
jgi:cellulose synthase/poly-beta-1,6-N-acetylglucosamine synthase-like glycosyltransferase